MATVTGLTAERMLEIEAASVVDGELDDTGSLILTRKDGQTIDAGNLLVTMDVLRDMLYPIGVIYMSTVDTNPALIFGGSWSVWGKGRVPVGVDELDSDFNLVEKVGGAKTHTLTAAQSGLPAHNHTQNAHNHTQNAHTHAQNAHTHPQDNHSHGNDGHGHVWNAMFTVGAIGGGGASGIPSGSSSWGNPSYGDGHWFSQGSSAVNIWGTTAALQVATPSNQNTTAVNVAATATNNAAPAMAATEGHNIQQQFITCYMWKRTE